MRDVNILISNGIDLDKSLEIFGDIEMYNESLETFMEEIDEKLEKMKEYKEKADMANYAILVHSLKSDSKYFGFAKLAEMSYKHEIESKENNIYFVYDNYDELINEAKRIINTVSLYLGKAVKEEKKIEIPKDKKILVVDDSNVIRSFIEKIFYNNFEVLSAIDGKDAIDILGLDYNNQIMAVLLDLNMPNIDGFEVLDYCKANDVFNRISIFIITGEDSEENVNRINNYPISGFLIKPFNEKDIKEAVEKSINLNIC